MPGLVDTEIDPCSAPELEQRPGALRQIAQDACQFGFALLDAEAAHRAPAFERGVVPFGGVADDPGPAGRPFFEGHLGHRQNARQAFLFENGDVELAPVDIALGEPVAAVARRTGLRARRHLGAFHH